MIFKDKRDEVIENIKKSAESGNFYVTVEPDDPTLSPEEQKKIVDEYLRRRKSVSFRAKKLCARALASALTKILSENTEIIGIEKLDSISGGALMTSNHFSPDDSTPLRLMARRIGKRINTVAKASNLAMSGVIGFLMNYADIIPLYDNPHYMSRDLMSILGECFEKGEIVLVYPEQEMWFNYRKPRPPQRGVYYMASKAGVPVISCFVELRDLDEMENTSFHKVKYILHVLDVIYPDSSKSAHINSIEMANRDYMLKKQAYEAAYSKPLAYTFYSEDIAGLVEF